nr:hypothetical protein [uncultured Methanobacterium sp.]
MKFTKHIASKTNHICRGLSIDILGLVIVVSMKNNSEWIKYK